MKISCVVPAYNDTFMLARCVFSIVYQEGVEFEILISDDSSTADVREAVRGWSELYPRVVYLEGPRTGNAVDNWNAGIERATGDYVTVIHHDDWIWRRDYLKTLSAALEAKGGDCCAYAQSTVVGGLRPTRFHTVQRLVRGLGDPRWLLPALNWIGAPSAFVFPRSVPDRFDRRLKSLVDVDFYVRVLRHRDLIKLSDLSIVTAAHATQITATIDGRQVAREELATVVQNYGGLPAWQMTVLKFLLWLRALKLGAKITPTAA